MGLQAVGELVDAIHAVARAGRDRRDREGVDQVGFLNARIQTWFPWSIRICLNGRDLNGFGERDLQRLCLAQPPATPAGACRRSAWAGRTLRLLRAHGVIYEVTGAHRYHLSRAGRSATMALLTALHSSVRQLTAAAA